MRGTGPSEFRSLTRTLFKGFGISAITLALYVSAIGCECPEMVTPACALYSRADTVFVGMLISMPSNQAYKDNVSVTSRFRIDEAFKGLAGTEVEVEFPFPRCAVPLNVGDKYLIYAHRVQANNLVSGFVSEACSGTKFLKEAVNDLRYLRALSIKDVHKSILGRVTGIRGQELEGIEVRARGVGGTVTSRVDAGGLYQLEPSKRGSYEVEVTLPLSLKVLAEVGMRVTEGTKTIIRYTAILEEGVCDYKELRVVRIYSGTISGKVVDVMGRPVPRISIHLYPFSEKPEFHSLGGQIAGTDAEGNYEYKSVKQGEYFLGVNLGQMASFSVPFDATFFPGSSSIKNATVISLAQNQQLSLSALKLPPRSVECIITGRLLWADGSPVYPSTTSATGGARPILYLLDPQNLEGISSYRPDGSNTIHIAEDGTFSFIAFEGHKYMVHTDAFNAQGQPMHAPHLMIAVDGGLQPLNLILSLEGTGRDKETIRKELNPAP